MTDQAPQDERRQMILDYTKQKTPTWVKEVIEAHLLIESEDAKSAGALGFMTRALVNSTMPYKDPKSDVFTRKNGDLTMRIVAGYEGGIPYGIYPRLLLAWLTTEAVRTRSPVIELGDSLSYFLREVLEVKRGGGPRGTNTLVTEQMKRLFGSMVNVSSSSEATGARFKLRNVTIADTADIDTSQFDLYRDTELDPALVDAAGRPLSATGDDETLLWTPQTRETAGSWRSTVTLTKNFYDECIDRPVPIDMRAYRALRRAPQAMDIYTWLTYRMSYTDRKTRAIPWAALMAQFGSNYTTDRAVLDWKKGFLKALKMVRVVYPNARFEITDKGFALLPSPTHVPRQVLQGDLFFGGQR